jgi:hypothetical protein
MKESGLCPEGKILFMIEVRHRQHIELRILGDLEDMAKSTERSLLLLYELNVVLGVESLYICIADLRGKPSDKLIYRYVFPGVLID